MTAVSLPEVPKGKELEDFVAAIFQASGHFVEKSIVEPGILELDAVATSYHAEIPRQSVIEVKSGDWGFSDVFKLLGWMTYLGLSDGVFVCVANPRKENVDFYASRIREHRIHLIQIDDFDTAHKSFESHGLVHACDPLVEHISRYSLWVERRLIEVARKGRSNGTSPDGARAAVDYYDLINHGIFFISDPRDKILALYEAFQKHPKLTLGIANEIEGRRYDPESPSPNNKAFRDAMYKAEHPLLQASMYLEHRARLAILKAVVDYCCLADAGFIERQPVEGVGEDSVENMLLPRTVQQGLAELKSRPYLRRYPVFWQLFLWCWGGFLLEDKEDEELELIAEQAGMPSEYARQALDAFDVLFPTSDKWLRSVERANCKLVKMVPCPLMGIGAFHRYLRYELKDYTYITRNARLLGNLRRWHRSAYLMLKDGQ